MTQIIPRPPQAAILSVPGLTPAATPADAFPLHSAGWHLFCHARDLERGPATRELCGKSIVVFRTPDGTLAAMDARCSHLGADLGKGTVHGNCLRCPFHHWEYGTDGHCTHIPAQTDIPRNARQRTYPAAMLGPFVFIFNGHEALYPIPFFTGCDPADFTPALPFSATLNCPWYLTGANSFDRQHFAAAHDRTMISEPRIDSPHPFARRASAQFRVTGTSWRDHLTRLFSGPNLTMTGTDWSGSLIFVTARFRRTTSYGMVCVRALESRKTFVQVFVWLPRSRNPLARLTLDPLNLALRRYFIRKFLAADADLLQGCEYRPNHLIAADAILMDYFHWLASVSNGLVHRGIGSLPTSPV